MTNEDFDFIKQTMPELEDLTVEGKNVREFKFDVKDMKKLKRIEIRNDNDSSDEDSYEMDNISFTKS